jgi:hypothetical protein
MKNKTKIRKAAESNLRQVIELSGEMMRLADKGDQEREDAGCGVLYGMLRDAAYKIRQVAEAEREAHRQKRANEGCV